MAKSDPIGQLVQRIAKKRAGKVPDVDPDGPRERSWVLIVLRDPGAKGSAVTLVNSPFANPDGSAKAQIKAFEQSSLDPAVCIWWNAVPWVLKPRPGRDPKKEKNRAPTPDELRAGVPYLRELCALLPELRVVVAMGSEAQEACRKAGISDAINVCHPAAREKGRPRLLADSLEQAADRLRRWKP